MTRILKICPKCGSNMILDIVYGLPSEDLRNKAKENKIFLGGCVIDHFSQDYKCNSCNFEFSDMITLEEFLVILLYYYSENNANTLSDDRKDKGILDAYNQLRKLDWKMKDPED